MYDHIFQYNYRYHVSLRKQKKKSKSKKNYIGKGIEHEFLDTIFLPLVSSSK
jgi:hypothetical protein